MKKKKNQKTPEPVNVIARIWGNVTSVTAEINFIV